MNVNEVELFPLPAEAAKEIPFAEKIQGMDASIWVKYLQTPPMQVEAGMVAVPHTFPDANP